MQIIDGRGIAESIYNELRTRIADLAVLGIVPTLGIIMVGDNPASNIYVKRKEDTANKIGLVCKKIILPDTASQNEIEMAVSSMNGDDTIHGFIVQLPLPAYIQTSEVLSLISQSKDIDGLRADSEVDSPTVKAVIRCIEDSGVSLSEKKVVVVGGGFFGRKIAERLRREGAIIEIVDKGFDVDVINDADVIISAVGCPGVVDARDVKDGVVIIDVGITHRDGRVLGDIDTSLMMDRSGYITPVPGGVGPVTVACLMEAVVCAAELTKNCLFD